MTVAQLEKEVDTLAEQVAKLNDRVTELEALIEKVKRVIGVEMERF